MWDKKIAGDGKNTVRDYMYGDVSLKRKFVEYYLASWIARFIFLMAIKSVTLVMLLFWACLGFSGLSLFAKRSVAGLGEKDLLPGFNKQTLVLAGLIILNFAHEFEVVAIGASTRLGMEQFVVGVLQIPVLFIFVYVFSLCHENLYRVRLYGYAKRKYRDKKKWPLVLLLMLLFEMLLSDFDAAYWKPDALSMVSLALCFGLRLFTDKLSAVNKALIWAALLCCYWIFIHNYMPELIKM